MKLLAAPLSTLPLLVALVGCGGAASPPVAGSYPASDPATCAGQADTQMRYCSPEYLEAQPPEAHAELPGNMRTMRDNFAGTCTDAASVTRLADLDACAARVETYVASETGKAEERRKAAAPRVAEMKADPAYQEILAAYRAALDDEMAVCARAEEAKALGPATAAQADGECQAAIGRRDAARAPWLQQLDRHQLDERDACALEFEALVGSCKR